MSACPACLAAPPTIPHAGWCRQPSVGAARFLRERANSYGRDATILRQSADIDNALLYEAIRDELRKCADNVEREAS